jgi:hypothetical protein
MRTFLSGCKYISDQEQFGKKDYWEPPEDFEKTRKGDCEDFALWAWRQLLQMGYPARFVAGTASRYGEGHAWVTFQKDGKNFILEPLYWPLGEKMARLSTLRHRPRFSVEWDGSSIHYYSHEERKYNPTLLELFPLVAEWLSIYTRYWLALPWKLLKRIVLGRPLNAGKPQRE